MASESDWRAIRLHGHDMKAVTDGQLVDVQADAKSAPTDGLAAVGAGIRPAPVAFQDKLAFLRVT